MKYDFLNFFALAFFLLFCVDKILLGRKEESLQMINQREYQIGDRLFYETFMGRWREVKVTNRVECSPDNPDGIKNGHAGFDGIVIDSGSRDDIGHTVWGYDDQIFQIVHEPEMIPDRGR